MSLFLNFDEWSISLGLTSVQGECAYKSKRVVGLLLKTMLWTDCIRTVDWLSDLSPYAPYKSEKDTIGASIEYFFFDFGRYCNYPSRFYLQRPVLEDFMARTIRCQDGVFGEPRALSVSQAAYGVWLFYRLVKPCDWDWQHENRDPVQKWFDVVKCDPEDWERLSGMPYGDVRCYAEDREYWYLPERWRTV